MSEKKLLPPCSYQGGKARLSKDVVDEIFKNSSVNENTKFYDMCCGSGAITLELINRGVHPSNIIMIDSGLFGSFWNSVANNEFEIYKFKEELDKLPSKDGIQSYLKKLSRKSLDKKLYIYHYLLMQSGSFGSKQIWEEDSEWKNASFRSYWKPTSTSNRKSPVNPMMPMPETLFNRVENIVNNLGGIINAIHSNIDDISWEFNDNSIIYIDPPYKETTGYGYNFDYMDFVEKYQGIIDIYISEKERIDTSDMAVILSKKRGKGGINGSSLKGGNEEWLNIFKKNNHTKENMID